MATSYPKTFTKTTSYAPVADGTLHIPWTLLKRVTLFDTVSTLQNMKVTKLIMVMHLEYVASALSEMILEGRNVLAEVSEAHHLTPYEILMAMVVILKEYWAMSCSKCRNLGHSGGYKSTVHCIYGAYI